MLDYIEIGPGPFDETCEQANVSGSNYDRMRAECRALIGQMRRIMGVEPEGARLSVRFNRDGDYGYYDVVCHYDRKIQLAVDYAYKCESECPAKWDATALKELRDVETGVQA